MKKISSLLACTILSASVFVACSSDEEAPSADECSSENYSPVDGAGGAVGGAGGEGGGPAAMCEAPEAPTETIEIAGTYTDNFGGPHEITAGSWNSTNLSLVNNEENYALGQSDETADYGTCLWNKFVWHEEGGKLYYCQIAYGQESECAAEAVDDPDTSDLKKGCNGFDWSVLTAD